MTDTLDLSATYVVVDGSSATALEGGDVFWRKLSENDPDLTSVLRGWLVATYKMTQSWANWEMHPSGDEIVHVLSGSCEFWLDRHDGPHAVEMQPGRTVIVPQGVWHTTKVHQPTEMLHMTYGEGTQFRPVE